MQILRFGLALLALTCAAHSASQATFSSSDSDQEEPLYVVGGTPAQTWDSSRAYIASFNQLAPRWAINGDYIDIIPAVNATGTIYAARAESSHTPSAASLAAGDVAWSSKQAIQAIDFVTGTPIWTKLLPSVATTSRPTSPVILGSKIRPLTTRIVTGTADGTVFVFNAHTGAVIFNETIPEGPVGTQKSAVMNIVGKDYWFYARGMRSLSYYTMDTATFGTCTRHWTKDITDYAYAFDQGFEGTDNSMRFDLNTDRRSDYVSGILVAQPQGQFASIVTRNVTSIQTGSTQIKYRVSHMIRVFQDNQAEMAYSPIFFPGQTLLEPCFLNNVLYVASAEGRAHAVNMTTGAKMWGPQGLDLIGGDTSFISPGRTCNAKYTDSYKQDVVLFTVRYSRRFVVVPFTKAGYASGNYVQRDLYPAFNSQDTYTDGMTVGIGFDEHSRIITSNRQDSQNRILTVLASGRVMARTISYDPAAPISDRLSVNSLWEQDDMYFGTVPLWPSSAPAIGPWGSRIFHAEAQNRATNNQDFYSNFHALVYVGCPAFSMGTACEQCMDGYFLLDSVCNECPNYGVGLYIAAIIAFIVLVIVLAKFGSAPAMMPITQFVNFAQIVGVLSVMKFSWPQSVRNLLNWFSFLNFNVDAAGPECTSGLAFLKDFNIKYLIVMMIPVAFFLVLGIASLIARCAKRPKWIIALKKAALMFCRLAFLPYIVKTLQYFDCTKRTNAAPDGGALWTWDAYPAINCFESNWMQWIGTTIPGFVFCIGTIILIVKKTRPEPKGGQTEAFDSVYGSLYGRYHTKFKWWELTVLGRKGWIAVVGLMSATNTTVSSVLSMVVLIVSVFGTMIYQPYHMHRHQVLESILVLGNLLTIVAAIISNSLGDSVKDGTFGSVAILIIVALILFGSLVAVAIVLLIEVKKAKAEKQLAAEEARQHTSIVLEEGRSATPSGDVTEGGAEDEGEEEGQMDPDLVMKRRYTMRRRNSFTMFNLAKAGKLQLDSADVTTPPGYTPWTAGPQVSRYPFRAAWIAVFFGIACAALVLAGWQVRTSATGIESNALLTMGLVIPGVALCIIPLMLISWASISLRSFVDNPNVVGLPALRHIMYVLSVGAYGFAFFVSGKTGDSFQNDPTGVSGMKIAAIVWAVVYMVLCVVFFIDFMFVIKQIRREWAGMIATIKRLTINAAGHDDGNRQLD